MTETNGTANILHQFTAYNQLREDYSPEVANALTQKNLERHNVLATLDDVEAWHRINIAAASSMLDIPAELHNADILAKAAATAILETAASQSAADMPETTDDVDDDLDNEEIENDEYERPSLSDIYGYDDDEDNEEAALDDILKLQEQAD